MAEKNQSLIILFAFLGVILVVGLILILTNGNNDEEAETVQVEDSVVDDTADIQESEPAPQPAPAPSPSTDSSDPQPQPSPQPPISDRLPEGWDSLTSQQKTALNPFDCPVDEKGFVYLSAETGECLEAPDDEDEIAEELPREDLSEAQVVGLGEAFNYDDNSEVSVTGLECVNLEFFVPFADAESTVGQFLSERETDYERYKTDSYMLVGEYMDQDRDLIDLEYYQYLLSFEEYLADSSLLSADESLAQQFIEYQICKVTVTLKNIGEDSSFADGCELRFAEPVSLVSQQIVYGSENRGQLYDDEVCTQAEVPFPQGATSSDIVSFIASSEHRITGILVKGTETTFLVDLERN